MAQVGAVLFPSVDVDGAVGAFQERHLRGLLTERAAPLRSASALRRPFGSGAGGDGPGVQRADPPGGAAVVAVDQGGVVGGDPVGRVALGVDAEHQAPGVPSAGELDAVYGAGGVPGVPLRGTDACGQVPGCGPGGAVVVAVLEVRGAVAGDIAAEAVGAALVVGLGEHDPAGAAVHDGRRVAVGVAVAAVDDLERAPGPAAVGGTLEDEVDVARVTAVVPPALGEREEGVLRGLHHGRYTEAEVAVFLGRLEEDLLVESAGRGRGLSRGRGRGRGTGTRRSVRRGMCGGGRQEGEGCGGQRGEQGGGARPPGSAAVAGVCAEN